MGTLAHFFLDTDLRCSHDGLVAILEKKKITVDEGEYVVFMNSARTMVKMFCGGNNALLHYKKDGRVLDPGVIRYLPKHCGGNRLNMDEAVKEHLHTILKRRKSQE